MAVGDNLLPATRATKIAESDAWTAWARIASIVGGTVMTVIVMPFVVWQARTTYDSSVTLTAHTGDIANVQTTVNKIETQSSADHDDILGIHGLISLLALRMTTAETAITIFWKRGDGKPEDKPQP